MRDEVEAEILARFAAPRGEAPPYAKGAVRADLYSGAERARQDAALVRASWVPLARESELAEPGAFRTATVGEVPLVCVRGEDGAVRVHENVCRHRGAQILREDAGVAASLTCPYHGFRYGLDGTLASCPFPGSLPADVRPGELALGARRAASYAGWIWAGPADGPSLRESLGPELDDELTRWPLADLTAVHAAERVVDFDWKIGVEAFLEPYHVPAIHTRSAHPVVDIRGIAVRDLAPHSRMALPFRLPEIFSATGALGEGAHRAGVEVFSDLNQAQRQSHLVYFVFPCTIWMLFPNHVLALRFTPESAERCRVRYELLAAPASTDDAERWRRSLAPGYEALVEEDLENLPWIQRGVRSGAAPDHRLSAYEARVGMFRDAYAAALEELGA